jgi:hypothetical protein
MAGPQLHAPARAKQVGGSLFWDSPDPRVHAARIHDRSLTRRPMLPLEWTREPCPERFSGPHQAEDDRIVVSNIGDGQGAPIYLVVRESEQYIAIMDVLESSVADLTPREVVVARPHVVDLPLDDGAVEALDKLRECGAVSARDDTSRWRTFNAVYEPESASRCRDAHGQSDATGIAQGRSRARVPNGPRPDATIARWSCSPC